MYFHLKSRLEGKSWEVPLPIISFSRPTAPLDDRDYGNNRQNLKVSSPEPVTILEPSGDIAKYKTL